MDTRTDPGQYYPGGRVMVRPDVAPPQGRVKVDWSDITNKPDFSDVAVLGAADSVGNVKTTVNKIVDKMKTAVIVLMCGLSTALSALAATTLNDLPGTAEVYTAAETDAAIMRLAPAPGDYLAVSNKAVNALSRAEAEAGFTEWTYVGIPDGATRINYLSWSYMGDVYGWTFDFSLDGVFYCGDYVDDVDGSETSLTLTCKPLPDDYESRPPDIIVTATRTRLPTMADLADIVSITNGLVTASITNGLVTAAVTNGLASVDYVDSKTKPVTNRYPLFVIDLNPGEARVWQHLELKATTNNFENTEGMTFFTATTSNGDTETGGLVHDWCHLFIASKRADTDVRRWMRIKNTGELGGYAPLTLAIIVDPTPTTFMRRDASRADNAAWLYEGNTNLLWSFSRIGDGVDVEHETDQDGRSCWRMIMPTRWYSELPGWAQEPMETPDGADVTPYTPPWTREIDDADTSYYRFQTLTNVNQSVQYVTSAANNTLSIEIPTGLSRTKDWVVYCNFDAETAISLPDATWWMADEAYTNAIPVNQPTALYFTQVTDGVFMLSRQELTSILIQH